MSTHKLAIGNVVEVPMILNLNDAGKPCTFKFTLICKRLDQDYLVQRIDQGHGEKVSIFMNEVITNWRGQRLILTDEGKPAEFSEEALELLWTIPGAALLAYQNYSRENSNKEKT